MWWTTIPRTISRQFGMQFCNGGNLAQHVLRGGSLPLETRVDIAIQVCWALEYIHGRGFLHGDLKAANVLLVQEGNRQGPLALLGDFGLARALGFSPTPEGSSRALVRRGRSRIRTRRGLLPTLAPELWEKIPTRVRQSTFMPLASCCMRFFVVGPLFSIRV